MLKFLLKRVVSSIVLLVVISFVAYLLLAPATGDIARNVLGENATEDQVAVLNQRLGLDQPVIVQYAMWLGNAVTGDLGRSYFTGQSVFSALQVRMPVTLSIVLLVTFFSGIIAFAIGTLAAVRRGWVDRVLQFFVTLADALPSFLIAIFLVTVFAIQLKVFPATGFTSFEDSPSAWARAMFLPVVALTINAVAGVAQQVRSATIAVMEKEYVRTLRSRGMSQRRIILTSVLRNASPNGLTSLAVQVIGILGGAVVIEQIFALPGLGSYAVESTTRTDIPLIIGIILATVLIVVVVNLLVDIAVAWANPKVRIS